MGGFFVFEEHEGFIYIYVSNESDSQSEVYFDDLKVTLNESNIVQKNSYYPFGLQHSSSWSRVGRENKYQFNAASELNEETQNYEMFFRSYDPVIGRMSGVDPYADSYVSLSPYNYAANDPMYFNDPSGGTLMTPPERDQETLNGGGGSAWASAMERFGSGYGPSQSAMSSYARMDRFAYDWAVENLQEAQDNSDRNLVGAITGFTKFALANNGGYWHHNNPNAALYFSNNKLGDRLAWVMGSQYNEMHGAWGNDGVVSSFEAGAERFHLAMNPMNSVAAIGMSNGTNLSLSQPSSLSGVSVSAYRYYDLATTFKGVPYLYGGGSCKGIDCSGIVEAVTLNGNNTWSSHVDAAPPKSAYIRINDPIDLEGIVFRKEFGSLHGILQKEDLLVWPGRHVAFFGGTNSEGDRQIFHAFGPEDNPAGFSLLDSYLDLLGAPTIYRQPR